LASARCGYEGYGFLVQPGAERALVLERDIVIVVVVVVAVFWRAHLDLILGVAFKLPVTEVRPSISCSSLEDECGDGKV
jgi:hypothetical protein